MGAIKRAFANNITTSGNLAALDAANLTGTLPAISGTNLTGTGKVLQTVIATNGSQISVSTSGVETANVQASLTPTSATTKILAFYTVGGVATENANRLEGLLKWQTTSGTTGGTQVANQYMANNGVAVNDMGTWAMSALIDHNTTSTVYVNGTVYTHDTGTTRYINVYGSDSQLVLLEVKE
jgi:hypothetical protein